MSISLVRISLGTSSGNSSYQGKKTQQPTLLSNMEISGFSSHSRSRKISKPVDITPWQKQSGSPGLVNKITDGCSLPRALPTSRLGSSAPQNCWDGAGHCMPDEPTLSPKHIPGVEQGVSRRGGAVLSCQDTGLIPHMLIRSRRDLCSSLPCIV